MDNQTIDVTSEGAAGILHALEIIWPAAAAGGKATHYLVVKLKPRTRYYAGPLQPNPSKDFRFEPNCDGLEDKHIHHFTDEAPADDGTETLILLWHEEQGSKELPYPLNVKQAAQFIGDWLGSLDYGRQPDHDGSNGKGWRIFTEGWGHVAGRHYAIVAAQPAWAMYGK